jgi:hypothetical protein
MEGSVSEYMAIYAEFLASLRRSQIAFAQLREGSLEGVIPREK